MGNIHAENISDIDGDVNIAGRDIVNYINTLVQRALTPGEVIERDLQIEVDALRNGIQDYLSNLREQVLNPEISEPYKGLEPYALSESQVFFGRRQAVLDLRAAMKRSQLTVLQAESGAGKTSLLQAGIIPGILKEQSLGVLIRAQFENPTRIIKRCFLRDLRLAPNLAETPLVNFLHHIIEILGHRTPMYLILDQFEEFFAKQTAETDRQDFIHDLAECLNDSTLNIRWVISVTSDTFGQLGKFEPYIRNPFSNVQSLYLFTRAEATEAIEKTAKHYRLSFEQGLVDRILNDLGNERNARIAPTQIQLVSAALYTDLREKSAIFNHAQYDAKNGAQGILHHYIDRVFQSELPPEERTVAYKVLEALVTSEKKRLIRTKKDLEGELESEGISDELLQATLNHLVAGRLLRRYGDDPYQIQYEIVHDYLLKEIDIDEGAVRTKQAEELLEDGLKAWRRNRKFLLTNEHLKFIQSQFDQNSLRLNEEQAEFLFLSAAINNQDVTRWLNTLSAEKIRAIIDHSIQELNSADPQIRRRAKPILWALRAYLPVDVFRKVYFERISSKIWILAMILVVVWLSYTPIRSWLSVPEFSDWEIGSKFEGQAPLNIAMNLKKPAEVYIADRTPGTVYSSKDSGDHWREVKIRGMDDVITGVAAVGDYLYILTTQTMWFSRDGGKNWEVANKIPLDKDTNLTSISINPNKGEEVYVGTNKDGIVYRTVDHGITWNRIPKGYDGNSIKAITTNGFVIILATEEGLWTKTMQDNTWNEISLSGCDNRPGKVTALSLTYPYGTLPPDGAFGFRAAIPGIGICDSDSMNLHGNTLLTLPGSVNLDAIYSMILTGDTDMGDQGYITTGTEILRKRIWFSRDIEWWKIRFLN
jgi:hypothetical protein